MPVFECEPARARETGCNKDQGVVWSSRDLPTLVNLNRLPKAGGNTDDTDSDLESIF